MQPEEDICTPENNDGVIHDEVWVIEIVIFIHVVRKSLLTQLFNFFVFEFF